MKMRLYLYGVTIEYERPPMPERRVRALCLLAAGGMYARMVVKVAASCGLAGVGVIAVATFLVCMIASA